MSAMENMENMERRTSLAQKIEFTIAVVLGALMSWIMIAG